MVGYNFAGVNGGGVFLCVFSAQGDNERVFRSIEYAHRVVERHFGVADEQAAIAGGEIAADIEMSKALAGKG